MNQDQLRKCIIVPALEAIDAYSEEAVELLMGTAAQESALGYFVKQITGPALGIFQMEPATHDDIWNNYLKYKPDLAAKVRENSVFQQAQELAWNYKYAAMMARIHYLRCPGKLPNEVPLMARYYKEHYNTPLGKATESEFIDNYVKYCT